jgi:predicted nucleic acid-binding protein
MIPTISLSPSKDNRCPKPSSASGDEVAAAYFVDSSALVKRYVIETGTAWVRRLTRRSPSTVIYIARITAVEVTSAVARRRKDRTLTSRKASSILHRFRQHLAGRYTIIEIMPALADAAMLLANTHCLRAYDAMQLAVALNINQKEQDGGFAPLTLISADQALNVAAQAEGLTVDDPNSHS